MLVRLLLLGFSVAFAIDADISAEDDSPVILDEETILLTKHFQEKISKRLVRSVRSSRKADPNSITANVGEYVDSVLHNFPEFIINHNLDPTKLPDLHTGFSKSILFIDYRGDINLTVGTMYDLSTIKRSGNAKVSYSPTTKKLLIRIPLGFKDIKFSYNYSATFMNLGPAGGVEGKVQNMRLNIRIGFDFNSYNMSITKFSIANSGDLTVKFTGHNLLDWIVNLFTEVVTTLLQSTILSTVTGIIRPGLDTVVSEVNTFIHKVLVGAIAVADIPSLFKKEVLASALSKFT